MKIGEVGEGKKQILGCSCLRDGVQRGGPKGPETFAPFGKPNNSDRLESHWQVVAILLPEYGDRSKASFGRVPVTAGSRCRTRNDLSSVVAMPMPMSFAYTLARHVPVWTC